MTKNKELHGLNIHWDEFREFLIIARNHSENSSAINSDKSRFNIISNWFINKEWNSKNFTALLSLYKKNGRSQGTHNKLIAMGKNIDMFQETNIVGKFKTKVEKIKKIEDVLSLEEMFNLATVNMKYSKYCSYINNRQKALFTLLSKTGCRISEALCLRWENIKNDEVKHVVFINTKNGDDRSVPIDDGTYDLLVKLQHLGGYVFMSGRGKKLSSGVVNADLKKRAKKLGIKKRVYSHLFRHSFATIMLENGLSDTDVCIIAGWRDQRMLMRYKNSNLEYYSNILETHSLIHLEKTVKNKLKGFSAGPSKEVRPQDNIHLEYLESENLVFQTIKA